jgi:hypothetical protein
MMTLVRTGSWIVGAGVVLVLMSCEEHPEIEITKVRENGEALRIGAAMGDRFNFSNPDTESPEEKIAGMLEWTVPAGWEQLPSRPLRVVNMRVGDAECYVTYLSSGTAAWNINRWRAQMGLPPASDAEIAAMRRGTLLERDAHRVDMTGTFSAHGGVPKENHRVLASYAQFPEFAMSVKMLGPKTSVEKAMAGFDEFCTSLAFKGSFGRRASKEPGAETHGGPKLNWDVPDGWAKIPGHEMRHVTFSTGEGTNCWITFLGRAAGSWADNVTRWTGEIGESGLDGEALAALPKLSLFGKQVSMLESYGKTNGVLGVMAILPDANMFVKLTGPNAQVKAQKSNFAAFCKSLRMDK